MPLVRHVGVHRVLAVATWGFLTREFVARGFFTWGFLARGFFTWGSFSRSFLARKLFARSFLTWSAVYRCIFTRSFFTRCFFTWCTVDWGLTWGVITRSIFSWGLILRIWGWLFAWSWLFTWGWLFARCWLFAWGRSTRFFTTRSWCEIFIWVVWDEEVDIRNVDLGLGLEATLQRRNLVSRNWWV